MDNRTRPEHAKLNGQIVGLNEKFSNGLAYPQEPNCRCVLGPALELPKR
jgi:SPP1 gp7 family putative phage head morphogenesis protein